MQTKPHPTGQELEEYIRRFGEENKHLAAGKSKQAAWFVSHCATQVVSTVLSSERKLRVW